MENKKGLEHLSRPNKIFSNVGFLTIFLMILAIIITSFRSPPEEVSQMLAKVSSKYAIYFLFIHIVMIFLLIFGLRKSKYRNTYFFGFNLFLPFSAMIISIIHRIIPNIILFGLIFFLLVLAYKQDKFKITFNKLNIPDVIFSILGLFFGFWYLHWIEDPIWLNAFLFSPLGGINCPTLLTLTGFTCLRKQKESFTFEIVLGFLTLYIGLYGVICLQVYIDIMLILCGGYLFLRSLKHQLKFIKYSQ